MDRDKAGTIRCAYFDQGRGTFYRDEDHSDAEIWNDFHFSNFLHICLMLSGEASVPVLFIRNVQEDTSLMQRNFQDGSRNEGEITSC